MTPEKTARPNLFSYATSELSQDAFICWLAAWAHPQYEQIEPKLHDMGRQFVSSMVHKIKPDFDVASIRTVDIRPQVGRLDVLILINKNQPDKLAILVEDKTHTSNHSNQLKRYYDQISKDYKVEMIPIYFKTGYQSRFDTLGAFRPYLRSDFLDVLRQGKKTGVDNAIFNDFLAHLEHMEYVIRQFSGKPLNEWRDDDWRGFFTTLYDTMKSDEDQYRFNESSEINKPDWNYVPNPDGGFFGYWWYFTSIPEAAYVPYLQLRKEQLTFRIKVDGNAERRNAREDAHQRIMQAASQVGIDISRPDRMGSGESMAVAYLKHDYRIVRDDKLDLDATLAILKKAQDVIDIAFRPLGKSNE